MTEVIRLTYDPCCKSKTYNRLAWLMERAFKANRTWQEQWKIEHYLRWSSNGGTWADFNRSPEMDRIYKGAYFCDKVPDGWREEGDADKVLPRLGHTGWYSDNYQSETYQGFVLQLPARRGVEQYVPAVKHSDADGITIWPLDISAEKEEAAKSADWYAEHMAEHEREYQAKESAKIQIEELREEIAQTREERRMLLADMRKVRSGVDQVAVPSICKALKHRIESLKRDSHKAFERITKLEDNYWEAVPQW